MKCPRCSLALAILGKGKREVLLCGGCKGLWIDAEVLFASLQEEFPETAAAIPPKGNPGETTCPRCAPAKMDVVFYERIEVDVCGKCMGVWLDGGELAAIQTKHRAWKEAPTPEEGWDALAEPLGELLGEIFGVPLVEVLAELLTAAL